MKDTHRYSTFLLAIILVALLAVPTFAQTEFLNKGESSLGVTFGFVTADGVTATGLTGYLTLISFIDLSYTKSKTNGNGSSSESFTSTGIELFIARDQLKNGEILFSFGAAFAEDQETYFGSLGYCNKSNPDEGKTAGELTIGQINVYGNSVMFLGASVGTSVRHNNIMTMFTVEVSRLRSMMTVGASIAISGVLKR